LYGLIIRFDAWDILYDWLVWKI